MATFKKDTWEENDVEKLSQVPFKYLWMIIRILEFQDHTCKLSLVTAWFQKECKTTCSENLSSSKPKHLTQVRNREQKLEKWEDKEFLNSVEEMEHKI